jgi:hypothetical protein
MSIHDYHTQIDIIMYIFRIQSSQSNTTGGAIFMFYFARLVVGKNVSFYNNTVVGGVSGAPAILPNLRGGGGAMAIAINSSAVFDA